MDTTLIAVIFGVTLTISGIILFRIAKKTSIFTDRIMGETFGTMYTVIGIVCIVGAVLFWIF